MDWPQFKPEFSDNDKNLFKFASTWNFQIARKEPGKILQKWHIDNDSEFSEWFNQDHLPHNLTDRPGFGVLLLTQPEEPHSRKNGDAGHNPQALRRLPISKQTLDGLIKKFFIHGSIARAINRSDAVLFSRTFVQMGDPQEPSIVYVCRSSASWPGDMALSSTYFPRTGSTYAVFYGCTFSDKPPSRSFGTGDKICGWLAKSDDAMAPHPMLIPGMFAEMERRRHLDILDGATKSLLEIISSLGHGTVGDDCRTLPSGGQGGGKAMQSLLDNHDIKIGLEAWLAQMGKMVNHIEELSETWFKASLKPVDAQHEAAEQRKSKLREAGCRIKDRLEDIMQEYREKVGECTLIMESMTLATQLASTQANMQLALSAKKDGGQMKSIAILTMIFLPATFFAAFFSMSFFKWGPQEEENVSSQIWIYAVVTLVSTAITLGVYSWWSWRQARKLLDK